MEIPSPTLQISKNHRKGQDPKGPDLGNFGILRLFEFCLGFGAWDLGFRCRHCRSVGFGFPVPARLGPGSSRLKLIHYPEMGLNVVLARHSLASFMSWSTSEALTDPAIREPMSFRSEFKFFLRDIPVEITLRLYNPIHSSTVIVRRSHLISVPGLDQARPANCEDQVHEGEALQIVISELVRVYNAAIAKGLKPQASWLQQNPEFR